MRAIKEKSWIKDSLVIMTTDHGGVNQIKDNGTTISVHSGNSEDEINVFLSVCGSGILAASKIEGDLSNLVCTPIALSALGIEVPKIDNKEMEL
ncbi:9739_t:CDS:2 [Cetraspora pellucida]|uniref:9739_t:CDS:1 n=1 Tax=Cetraspora pellucida TaxID=1433469 RepID=A0ACA9LFW6_9GLOM|nr:9739_t:CDS:2 [Cetraspora pellucida]